MDFDRLVATAQEMVSDNRGLLAADESTGTIGKRFDQINVENTEPNRRAYREMLFRSEGLGEFISGAILFDETIRQKRQGRNGTLVRSKSSNAAGDRFPGIKVDAGAKPMLPGSPGEKVTEGLDGLPARMADVLRQDRRALRQVAGRDHDFDRRSPPQRLLHRRQCRTDWRVTQSICQEGRDRSDRRTRGADGRRPLHRPSASMGNGATRCAAVFGANCTTHGSRARRHDPETQHGDFGQGLRRNRRAADEVAAPHRRVSLQALCSGRRSGGHVPVRRTDPKRMATEHLNIMNAAYGPLPSVEAEFLLRTGAAGKSALKAWKGEAANDSRGTGGFHQPRQA